MQHKVGGSWGNHIQFMYPELVNPNKPVKFHGHMTPVPKVGDTILAEMKKSWMTFEIIEVEKMYDPPDQFFAWARCVDQKMK